MEGHVARVEEKAEETFLKAVSLGVRGGAGLSVRQGHTSSLDT